MNRGPRDSRTSAPVSAKQRLRDMLEANAHLVRATLMAEQLGEMAKRAKRQQDEFIAMLAHELRNPLAPIRSAAALLERLEPVDPRVKAISDIIGRQVAHMARLLDDLLDASRVTSGKVSLRRRPTSVAEFVDEAVETTSSLIESQRQTLTLTLPPSPLYVNGDPTRLAQVVGNLLHNASKYTPDEGTIDLSVRQDGSTVVLCLKDNGGGIAEEAIEGIFDLFTQEERSLSRSHGGLGVGLAVVHSMVQLHGGSIAVHSDGVGRGTEFTVVLPRIDHVAEPAVVPTGEPGFVAARVLVVDDNQAAGDMLAMLLQVSGHEVEVARDGLTALTAFVSQRSQVVLCDIGLPDLSGFEVGRRMRLEKNENDLEPLLIALTGYDSPADRARTLASGFDCHVAKPADFEALLELIQAHFAVRCPNGAEGWRATLSS
ncbi:hybrid sensor histidine kinase/response regulator [Variovorax sp. LT1P1]|uniref:hybrid sensor histidine kinase/response regulator n=1 Tax=Variovorax sp. LT1P1 TaxID=3443730 RepID=UPI003F48B69D